jgi:hypothetical protein
MCFHQPVDVLVRRTARHPLVLGAPLTSIQMAFSCDALEAGKKSTGGFECAFMFTKNRTKFILPHIIVARN